jgi:hypothetical protein
LVLKGFKSWSHFLLFDAGFKSDISFLDGEYYGTACIKVLEIFTEHR